MKKIKFAWIWIILSVVTSLGMLTFVYMIRKKEEEV